MTKTFSVAPARFICGSYFASAGRPCASLEEALEIAEEYAKKRAGGASKTIAYDARAKMPDTVSGGVIVFGEGDRGEFSDEGAFVVGVTTEDLKILQARATTAPH